MDNVAETTKTQNLDLIEVEIDDLYISEFDDENVFQDHENIAKVMAASCTTCECCCSCSSSA